jgi:hypothetical protein
LIEGEDVNDRTRGAKGLLALEGLGTIDGVGGDGAGSAAVLAGFGFQPIKTLLAVMALPAGKGGRADGAAGRMGDVVVAFGDLLPLASFAARWELTPEQG